MRPYRDSISHPPANHNNDFMKNLLTILLLTGISLQTAAQEKKKRINGMYVQWGYNTEWYTKSNIHFKMGNGNNFTLHKAKAHDKPDLDGIINKPGDISIPQYNYRIGFYLNKTHTRAIEINFDHAKYVVTDNQRVNVTGTIDGKPVNGDSILNPGSFLHLEHTDGANWLHINYVQQRNVMMSKDKKRPLVNLILKAGAGINIPRTDFTWRGDRLNNNFHVSGYNFGAEAGARLYISRKFFLEGTTKTGFVKYINALASTNSIRNSYVKHSFGYLELIGLFGYDINF